jgi:drug/metabolite transporter (DMT)-like permease
MKSKSLFFLFVFMILIWGVSFPFNKIGLGYTSPTNYIEWRLIIATFAVLIMTLASKNFVIPRKKDFPIILAVGVFQMGLTLTLTNFGLSMTPTGKTTFIVFTTPIWIILITGIINKRMTLLDCSGLILGIVGTILLINPLEFRLHDYTTWAGDISLVLAALAWSIGIILTRRLKWHSSPLKLLFWQALTATVMVIIYAFCRGVSIIPDSFNFVLIGSLLYTGILSIALGYWLMVILSKNLIPAVTSFGLLWVPIISLVLSHIFLNEPITMLLLVSVLLIIVGILLHIYSEIKTHNRNRDIPP